MLESVMITLKGWICSWFDLIPYEDYNIALACIDNEKFIIKDQRTQIESLHAILDQTTERLNKSAEANAELHIKLKQVTFLENRVQELEIAAAKQKIEPKKVVDEKQPIITGRAGWRAIAQMRSASTVPDAEPDSVKDLDKRVAKEVSP
jgi:uncharacterized coiled-coil protein SlyX